MWSLQWGKEYEFLVEREERGFDTPALDRLPTLEPDQAKILKEFMRLNKKRPQSFGKVPCPIPTQEIMAAWDLRGFKAAGMTRKEFADIVEDLDAALIDFYIKRDG